jgi:hypothetical protein
MDKVKNLAVSKITKEQAGKIVKAAVYVGASAVVAYLISVVTDNPDLFGALTPVVNVALVALKQVFTKG